MLSSQAKLHSQKSESALRNRQNVSFRRFPCAPPLFPAFSIKGQTSSGCQSVATPLAPSLVTAKVIEREQEEQMLLPLPRAVENLADDANLHNPLQRMERLSTSWFGVILGWDGVIVMDTLDAHIQAWNRVAEDMKLKKPLGHVMRRVKGLRDEAVVTRVFNWTQNPSQIADITAKKRELYAEIVGDKPVPEIPGAAPFLEMLKRYNIPVALACGLPELEVRERLSHLNLLHFFDEIITGEDIGTRETEFAYAVAAQRIQRPPIRCIVIGDSNYAIEAAHELNMKSLILSTNVPVYNLIGADLVVRNLSQVTMINMKKLFATEDLVEPKPIEEFDDSDPPDFDDGYGDFEDL